MSEPSEDSSIPEDPGRAARMSRPQPLFAVGDTVPGLSSWLLERKLGSGGFGEVWLVRHELRDERRAVKFCTDPIAHNRLVTHEKKVVARVMKHAGNHPNIVPLLEHNLDGETPWLMYEFVEGGTLAEAIDSWKPLAVDERVKRTVQTLHTLAGALATFHQLDPPIVHRDLKPANVLMASEVPRITDFGIGGAAVEAAISESTTSDSVALPTMLRASGTLMYASPEQRRGSEPSPRDDVYALGVIAYQMIMADREDPPGPDAHVVLGEANVPPELMALIVRSTAPKAERRPKDASDWQAHLAVLLPTADPPPDVREIPLPLALTAEKVIRLLRVPPAPPQVPPARSSGTTVEFQLPRELKMTFCWVPPGACQLGSPKAERAAVLKTIGQTTEPEWLQLEAEENRPRFHTAGFWLAKYPVTQAEWFAITGASPSHFQVDDRKVREVRGLDTTRFPVEQVSWDTICGNGGFLDRVNAIGGAERAFGKAGTFALPHEDMWEYACRGGLSNQQPFYFGAELNGTQANVDGNYPFGTTTKGASLERPTPVGHYEAKCPHPWELCDLHGNVWEWCENAHEKTTNRVARGGSWSNDGRYARAASRGWFVPGFQRGYIGVRLCFTSTS